ncbi:Dabb family protein [Alkaliphilus transvaalensis]|uniref:Dabb family protein n=1 Tax=Alkaliphilus transvaalensis TaxID=114628 RepID=UPI00047EAD14|nr:Dabb family protein [Alkaliphilus transvaalensis]
MIRHIVAWNYMDGFCDEENQENAEKVKYELENLKNLISEIVEMKVILNPAKTSNRKVVLISLFYTEQDLANYQVHPEHKRVSQFVGSVMKDRVCLDLFE